MYAVDSYDNNVADLPDQYNSYYDCSHPKTFEEVALSHAHLKQMASAQS